MAYFEFPNTRNYEGDLGWIIKNLNEVVEVTKYLQEEWSKIVVLTEDYIQNMIDTSIAENNVKLAKDLKDLKEQITTEYIGYVTAQLNTLTIYIDNQDVYYDNLAQSYAAHAESQSKAYTDNQVLTYTMMVNPITGVYEDVRLVVDDIVSYFHTQDSLTASEYDLLDMTATYYDSKQLSAYDYDFNGKTLLP